MGDTCNKRKLMIRKGAILRTHEKLETSLRTGTVFMCPFYLLKISCWRSFSRPSNVSSHNGSERIDEKLQQISYNSVEDITDDIRKQIGWRIQEKRIEKGITAVDLSTYLNITANQVSRIERGCAGIDIYKLIVICKILGVSADYILFGEMKEENITISKEQFEAINGLISMFGKEKL